MEEDNLVAIMYDAESSESEHDAVCALEDEADDELEAIKSNAARRVNAVQNKRRKIADSEDEEDGDVDDEDSDLDAESRPSRSAQKEAKRKEMEKEKARKLAERKRSFFGGAPAGNGGRKKRYKVVPRSFVNAKGMLVTEDVKVTDDEEGGDEAAEERKGTHRHQEGGREEEDRQLLNQENAKERANGGRKRQKGKSKGGGNRNTAKKPAKNGSITSFFKAK